MYGSTGASQSVKRSLEDSAALARESESIGIDALHEMMRQRELLEQASENVCFRVSNTSFRQYMLNSPLFFLLHYFLPSISDITQLKPEPFPLHW